MTAAEYKIFQEKQYREQKALFLPVIDELANRGEWEAFCKKVQMVYEVMPEAFRLYYDKIPEEHKRPFVLNCYMHNGDKIPECRQALISLKKDGWKELPGEYRNREEMTIYRAGEESPEEAPERISWTASKAVALWFLHEWGNKHAVRLYKGVIKTKDIIAYTDEREEREIMQYKSVYDIVVDGTSE